MFFPLAHLGVVVLHLGFVCIVKCEKTNVVEQGWLSSVYCHAHYFILFLQVIHVIIDVFCIQHSGLETMQIFF